MVFFASEAGSWQVGVDWRAALSACFRCLDAHAAEDVAQRLREATRQRGSSRARAPVAASDRSRTDEMRGVHHKQVRVPVAEPRHLFGLFALRQAEIRRRRSSSGVIPSRAAKAAIVR